ncbi:ROK family protein [Amnibacterium sp.]|uniref:ROK family protein n=1 Tax=Amnibacterium sp. TaxID=1872496 RepID=UPI00260A399C|nr:ROK family protein [Amnibacterium sp.]
MHKVLSRVELSERMGFTVAAMTNIVRSLLSDGFIEEAGSSGNTGGKPRTLLRIKGDSAYAVGVSVDLESMSFVLVNLAGDVVDTLPTRASPQGDETLAAEIARGVDDLLERTEVPRDRVIGVGIAGQGPHGRSATGRASAGPYADQWLDDEVGHLVTRGLDLPVLIQNDANAVAAGEFSLSLDARTSGNFACVYLGESGLGSGIFTDGQLLLGSNSYAGAIAHLSIDVDGPECFCGSRGCLELYSAPRSIIEAVRAHDEDAADDAIGVAASGPVTMSDVARVYSAARSGHPYAAELVSDIARYVASASATMATLLDLNLIVFSGDGFLGIEELCLTAARDVAGRFMEVGARPGFAVRMSQLGPGNVAAAVGAAVGALEALPMQVPPLIAASGGA